MRHTRTYPSIHPSIRPILRWIKFSSSTQLTFVSLCVHSTAHSAYRDAHTHTYVMNDDEVAPPKFRRSHCVRVVTSSHHRIHTANGKKKKKTRRVTKWNVCIWASRRSVRFSASFHLFEFWLYNAQAHSLHRFFYLVDSAPTAISFRDVCVWVCAVHLAIVVVTHIAHGNLYTANWRWM